LIVKKISVETDLICAEMEMEVCSNLVHLYVSQHITKGVALTKGVVGVAEMQMGYIQFVSAYIHASKWTSMVS
jgi:hypothetical protein